MQPVADSTTTLSKSRVIPREAAELAKICTEDPRYSLAGVRFIPGEGETRTADKRDKSAIRVR